MSLNREKESFLAVTVKKLMITINMLLEVIKQKEGQEPEPLYRVVNYFEKKGVLYCQVITVGTGSIADETPAAMLADFNYMLGFNKKDMMTITNMANYEKYKPKIEITSIMLEDKIVEVKNLSKKKKLINLDKENEVDRLVENMSSKDAFELGRLMGENENIIDPH